jgi:hypothetical protein
LEFRRDDTGQNKSSKCFGFVQSYDDRPKRRLFELLKSQGMQENQQVVFLSDGGEDVRNLQFYLNPQAEHLLDWFHVTMFAATCSSRISSEGALGCPTDTRERAADFPYRKFPFHCYWQPVPIDADEERKFSFHCYWEPDFTCWAIAAVEGWPTLPEPLHSSRWLWRAALPTSIIWPASSDVRLDAALTVASSSKQMRGLVFEHLRTYPLYLAVNASHRLARAKRVNLSQLQDEPLIVYSRADYPEYYESLASLFEPIGGMPEIAEEHDSATSLIAAIEAGRGIALVASVLSSLAGSRITLRENSAKPNAARCGSRLSSAPSQSRRAPVYQDREPAGRGSVSQSQEHPDLVHNGQARRAAIPGFHTGALSIRPCAN